MCVCVCVCVYVYVYVCMCMCIGCVYVCMCVYVVYVWLGGCVIMCRYGSRDHVAGGVGGGCVVAACLASLHPQKTNQTKVCLPLAIMSFAAFLSCFLCVGTRLCQWSGVCWAA